MSINVTFTKSERASISLFVNTMESAVRYRDPASFKEFKDAMNDAVRSERSAWNDADSRPMAQYRIANAFMEGIEAAGEKANITVSELAECTSTYSRAFLAGRRFRNVLRHGAGFDVRELIDDHRKAGEALETRRVRWNAEWDRMSTESKWEVIDADPLFA